MSWADALRLGRVSNLPTVWTNALAGLVLAGGWLAPIPLVLLVASVSLAYVGGMFLNDAFDAEIDKRQRPERPIPSGRVRRETVYAFGFGMLAAAVLGLTLVGLTSGTTYWPAAAGLVLAGLIVLYNWRHKENPLSPVVMGLCRVLVYVTAGLAGSIHLPAALWIGAALLLGHLIGLTYAAKQETLGRVANLWPLALLAAPLVYGLWLMSRAPPTAFFWIALFATLAAAIHFILRRTPGDIGRAVMTLIAAISLLDAMLIAGQGRTGLAWLAACGFVLTLVLQRFVRGT